MQGPRTPFIYLAVVFGLFVVPQISHYARSVENRTATSTHLIIRPRHFRPLRWIEGHDGLITIDAPQLASYL